MTPGLPKISQSQRDDAVTTPYRATRNVREDYYHRHRKYYYDNYWNYYFLSSLRVCSLQLAWARSRTTIPRDSHFLWLTIKLPVLLYRLDIPPAEESRCAGQSSVSRPVVRCRGEYPGRQCMCVYVSTSTSSAHARTTTRDHETSAYATPGQYKEMVNVEHCVKGNVTKLTQRPDRGDKRIRERVVELCLFCPRLVSRAGSFCVLLRTRISRERERESENFANSEIGLNKL